MHIHIIPVPGGVGRVSKAKSDRGSGSQWEPDAEDE